MPIDFDLTTEQRKLKGEAREFAREVLRPVAERADALPDPHEAFVAMRPVYEQAVAAGYSTMFLPEAYGGGGASTVDFLLAIEELCAVDPGFPTILLVNGLALMPLLRYGTEDQRERWIGAATADVRGDFLAGWVVSERGGTANFDHPSPRPASSSSPTTTGRAASTSCTARSTGRATRAAGISGAPTSTSAWSAPTAPRAARRP